jgi:Rps23 Pro-64 3,4-dihydroxylase Tpa1-like proline 4-hydroxylase
MQPTNNTIFNTEKLKELASSLKSTYQNNYPFSHVVIDNFLPPEVLEEVLEDFPNLDSGEWLRYASATENGKLASREYLDIPPRIRKVLNELNTPPFLAFLEELTGIEGLIPDPYFFGGGMHQTQSGGWLSIHVDFNRYKKLNLYRHINVLLYLNKEWKEEYGGHLELWDSAMKHRADKVAPLFNRCVIFTTSENSHHGHPDPLACPPDRTRKSLAWYYYTTESEKTKKIKDHSTVYKPREGTDEEIARIRRKEVIRGLIPLPVLALYRAVKSRVRKTTP